MSFTPYDWNQSVLTRMEYIEERIRDGSPVVGISIPDGVLLVSFRRTQRKVFEIYDRLIFGAIGHQSDVETMRNAAIDFAHREGFQRSPDDVTAQRLVGSTLSPALKKAFGDPFTVPLIFRGLFAEMGQEQDHDVFYALNFDGEFKNENRYSVAGPSLDAENKMIELLDAGWTTTLDRDSAVRLAFEAWATGKIHARRVSYGQVEEDDVVEVPTVPQTLKEELAHGAAEVGILERRTARESKFRLLRSDELEPLIGEFR